MDSSEAHFWVAKSWLTNVRPSLTLNGEGHYFYNKEDKQLWKEEEGNRRKAVQPKRVKLLIKSMSKHHISERQQPLSEWFTPPLRKSGLQQMHY